MAKYAHITVICSIVRVEDRYSFFVVYIPFFCCVCYFFYVVKRLEQLIKMDMALYKSYVLLLLLLLPIVQLKKEISKMEHR